MSEYLFWIPLLTLLGTFVPLLTEKLNRNLCALLTSIAPALALLLVLQSAEAVFHSESLRQTMGWFPVMGLELAFRLDGLSLLFSILIIGIGLLVILYARYYLSEQESIGRFYAYLILFMTAMLGIVLSNNLIQLW
ncbi:hypothetical protein BTA35_0216845, partial [Oceanospirillum linum]